MLDNVRNRNIELINKYSNDMVRNKNLNIIKELLLDDKCFFKLNISESYSILRDLEYTEEELKDIYMDLISYNNF